MGHGSDGVPVYHNRAVETCNKDWKVETWDLLSDEKVLPVWAPTYFLTTTFKQLSKLGSQLLPTPFAGWVSEKARGIILGVSRKRYNLNSTVKRYNLQKEKCHTHPSCIASKMYSLQQEKIWHNTNYFLLVRLEAERGITSTALWSSMTTKKEYNIILKEV